MSMQAYVATRKGLFELSYTGGRWEFGPVHFLGDPVSMVLPDRRDGTLYAALNLGHFGVKLHRKQGEIWTELPAPAYCHHELVRDAGDIKLAKSRGSVSLRDLRDAGWTPGDVRQRLGF